MSNPILVDLPHSLGAEEAKRRIANGMGDLGRQIPGGAQVRSDWTENRLNLFVSAMGQDVHAKIDVHDSFVRVELLLPPALGFFGRAVEKVLRRKGADLLEDKRGGKQ